VTTFNWRDALMVSVNEMSRTQALDCAREFDLLLNVVTDIDELMREADVLGVLHAPAIVKWRGEVLGSGEQVIQLDEGESIKLVLPLTRECFNALPMSLTQLWVNAMIKSNGWLVEELKKVLSLTSPSVSEPKSGDAPSTDPMTVSPATTTTG
jgi:hypothetical protein